EHVRDDLDRDVALQLEVVGPPHDRHPAAADDGIEAVAAVAQRRPGAEPAQSSFPWWPLPLPCLSFFLSWFFALPGGWGAGAGVVWGAGALSLRTRCSSRPAPMRSERA